MKSSGRIIILSIICAFACVRGFAQEADAGVAWDSANTAYINGDYARAAAMYDSLAGTGFSGEKLFYNLGNAYFKQNMTGKALLNYYRALRLDPSDADIKYNIQVANTYIKDKIEPVPEFFLSGWIRLWGNSLSSNSWAVVSLVMLAVALGAVLLYLLVRDMKLRKTGFYTAIAALVVCAFAAGFAIDQKRSIVHPREAVVMSTATSVKSSPGNNGKEIFLLHEGTKVTIEQRIDQWMEISIADGNKGWIHQDAIEVI